MAQRGDNQNIRIPMCGFVSTFHTSRHSEPDYLFHLVTYTTRGWCDTRIAPAITNCHLFEPNSTAYFSRPLPETFCDSARNIHNFPHLPVPYIQSNFLHLICLKRYSLLPIVFEFNTNFPYVCTPVFKVYDMLNTTSRIPIFYISKKVFEDLKSAYFCRTIAKAFIPIPSEGKVVLFNNPFTSATWDLDRRIYGKIAFQSEVEDILGDIPPPPPPPNPPRGPNQPGFERSDGGGDTVHGAPNVGPQYPNLGADRHGGGAAYQPFDGVSHPAYNTLDRLFNGDDFIKENLENWYKLSPKFHYIDLNDFNCNIFAMSEDLLSDPLYYSINNLKEAYFGHVTFEGEDYRYKKRRFKMTVLCRKAEINQFQYHYYIVQNRYATLITTFIEFPENQVRKLQRFKFSKPKYPVNIYNSDELESFVDQHVVQKLPKNPLATIYGTDKSPGVVQFLNSLRNNLAKSSEPTENQIYTRFSSFDFRKYLTTNNPFYRILTNFSRHIMSNFSEGFYVIFPIISESLQISENQYDLDIITHSNAFKGDESDVSTLDDEEKIIMSKKRRELLFGKSVEKYNAMFPKVIIEEKTVISDEEASDEEPNSVNKTEKAAENDEIPDYNLDLLFGSEENCKTEHITGFSGAEGIQNLILKLKENSTLCDNFYKPEFVQF